MSEITNATINLKNNKVSLRDVWGTEYVFDTNTEELPHWVNEEFGKMKVTSSNNGYINYSKY